MSKRKVELWELETEDLVLFTCDECFDEALTMGGTPAGWSDEDGEWLCRDCSKVQR